MTAFSDRIVAEARSWIGTPYHHQYALRGVGTDCLGLLRGVWVALHGEEPEMVPPYTQDWAEPSGQETLLGGADRWLLRRPDGPAEPGDVLLFRMRDGRIAKHLGIAARRGTEATFIHAYSGHGVVESPLSMAWVRRIAARFVFPEGAS